MMLNLASGALLGVYIALLLGAIVALHRRQYDGYVRFEIAAWIVVVAQLVLSIAWGDDWITDAIWALNLAIQTVAVIVARKQRSSRRNPHAVHVCNEDCPGWATYGSGLR